MSERTMLRGFSKAELIEMVIRGLEVQRERDALLEDVAHMQERSFAINEEFAVLRAERDALRAALQRAMDLWNERGEGTTEWFKAVTEMLVVIDDALAQTDTRP